MIRHDWLFSTHNNGRYHCRFCAMSISEAKEKGSFECTAAPERANRFDENGNWLDEKDRKPHRPYGEWYEYLETWEREFIDEAEHLQEAMKYYNNVKRLIRQRAASRAKFGYKPRVASFESQVAAEKRAMAERTLTPP